MSVRYLFLCPDRKAASGGIAVIYDLVALLNRSGYDAAVVHSHPSAGYPDHSEQVPAFFSAEINRVTLSLSGRRQKLLNATRLLQRNKSGTRLPTLVLGSDDRIVVPEFLLSHALRAFPGRKLIALVQNPFTLTTTYGAAIREGLDIDSKVQFWLGVSPNCQTHIDMIDVGPSAYFPVSMKPQEFPFRTQKKKLITYMPRKYRYESFVLEHALRKRNRLAGYQIEALDSMPRAEISKKLQESRFFISLLYKESIGFPAAEAMSAGCIVVGFDGLGGAEFFNEATGIPVENGDFAALTVAVEKAVDDYEKDPAKFDILRKAGAERVNKAFSTRSFEQGALAVWKKIEDTLNI